MLMLNAVTLTSMFLVYAAIVCSSSLHLAESPLNNNIVIACYPTTDSSFLTQVSIFTFVNIESMEHQQ